MNKLECLIHYVVSKCKEPSKLGATKLNKILWFADTSYYQLTGRSITEAEYEKRQFGPVPVGILHARKHLRDSGLTMEKDAIFFGAQQRQIISIKAPKLDCFNGQEISLADEITDDICNNHTASSISDLSHTIVWEAAEIGEIIPLCAIFSCNMGEINLSDMQWAKRQISCFQ